MKQFIICPKCGSIELTATITELPFKIHRCEQCNYLTTSVESEDWKPAKAISIKQPWAWLICSGIKDIENRTWKTNYRGRVLIHAGKKYNLAYDDWVHDILRKHDKLFVDDFDSSAIIGSVEIVDCVWGHASIWAEKQHCTYKSPCQDLTKRPNCWDGCMYFSKPIYNWVLANPILFERPILGVKGKLSFFVPELPNSESKPHAV